MEGQVIELQAKVTEKTDEGRHMMDMKSLSVSQSGQPLVSLYGKSIGGDQINFGIVTMTHSDMGGFILTNQKGQEFEFSLQGHQMSAVLQLRRATSSSRNFKMIHKKTSVPNSA